MRPLVLFILFILILILILIVHVIVILISMDAHRLPSPISQNVGPSCSRCADP
jgi:hypothetical protein